MTILGIRVRPLGCLLLLVIIAVLIYLFVVPAVLPRLHRVLNPTAVPTQVPPSRPTQLPVAKATATPVPPTAVPVKPTAVPGKREKLTVSFDSFGSYFTAIQVFQIEGRSYDLELVPFLFNGENEFTEDQRAQNIKDGTWDFLLTTGDSLAKKGNIGKIVAYIDQSAGADKIVTWPSSVTQPGKKIGYFNDLKDMTIAFSEGSVGQYQLLAMLRVVLLTPNDVKFFAAKSVAEAVDLFLNRQVDAVAGWEPDITKALDAGGVELVSSSWWRNISDVVVVSDKANTNKRETVKAFLKDWFLSLKQQQEDFGKAAATIAGWKYNDQPTNDWTYVYPDSSVPDLEGWLVSIAQSGLGENTVLMQEPQLIADQLATSREVWSWGNLVDQTNPFDPMSMIETSYVLELSQDRSLYPTRGSFVNSDFQATSQKLPSADPNVLIKLPAVAELPIKRLDFEPNSSIIKKSDLDAIAAAAKAMIQMTKVSDVQILVTGYSAWPFGYDEAAIWQQAEDRAIAVKLALVKAGLYPDRVTTWREIPPEADRRTRDESRMVIYRKVTIEAKRGGK